MSAVKPSWEVPHSLGAITWREARGRYEIRLRERPNAAPTSTYVRGPRTPATYELAERELADRITRTTRGERHVGRSLTVGAWLDEWLELRPDLKPTTRAAYELRIERYLKPELGRIRLVDLEPADVTRAMIRLRAPRKRKPGDPWRTDTLSAGSVDAAYRVLNAALAEAWELGKAPRNACRGAKHERPSTHVEPPSDAELDRLFAELAGDEWLPLFELVRWTGCRLGEALGLERRHVDTTARTVTFVRQRDGRSLKAGRPRTVAIPPHVAELLERVPVRLGSDLVFSTRTGRGLDERNVLRHFDSALERAGIAPHAEADLRKYRIHDLRHASATRMLEAGISRDRVRAWHGWASDAMLDRYGHVRPMAHGPAYERLVDVFPAGDLVSLGLVTPELLAAAASS